MKKPKEKTYWVAKSAKIASSFGNRWDDETGFDNYVGEDVAKAIRARGQS